MRLSAYANKLECDMKDQKITGCFFLKLDIRDGGIGGITLFDTQKVGCGSAVFMTENGSYALREICTK